MSETCLYCGKPAEMRYRHLGAWEYLCQECGEIFIDGQTHWTLQVFPYNEDFTDLSAEELPE